MPLVSLLVSYVVPDFTRQFLTMFASFYHTTLSMKVISCVYLGHAQNLAKSSNRFAENAICALPAPLVESF